MPLTHVEIYEESRGFVDKGVVGEIVVAGPCEFRTYLGRPAERDAVTLPFDGRNWYRSGDLGFKDKDGFVYIVDRSKDMIISGGENVYSLEVEIALLAHDDVGEAAVVGEPSDIWGEQVVAVVAPKPGRQLSARALAEACSTIADYKRPKRFVFLDALPRNSFGKVQKSEIRELVRSSAA